MQALWVDPLDFASAFPGGAEIIIVAGSGATVRDLQYLRASGGEAIIRRHLTAGGVLVGVCGGYQMFGQTIYDPLLRQGSQKEIEGLGLLPIKTLFGPRLLSANTTATCLLAPENAEPIKGEEHRSGYSFGANQDPAFLTLNKIRERKAQKPTAATSSQMTLPSVSASASSESQLDAPALDGLLEGVTWAPMSEAFDGLVSTDRRIWGTYIHLIFHNDSFNQLFFNSVPLGS